MGKNNSKQTALKVKQALRNERSRECHRIRRHEKWSERHPAPVRTSTNPPPTLDELRAAYDMRNSSPENMIRLGSLMEDLEAAYPLGYRYEYDASTDYHFVDYDAPWQNGIKGFLKQDPFLFSKYKTLMRYKKLSADFRQAIGLADPYPATTASEILSHTRACTASKIATELPAVCGHKTSFTLLANTIRGKINS